MKVVAFNGSARKEGNTAACLKKVLGVLEAEGIETELVNLAGKKLGGCRACYRCMEKKDRKCHGPNDDMNELIELFDRADGVIIGSPTYFSSVSTETKALIDRVGLVGKANGHIYEHKVGAAVAVARRHGATDVFTQINRLYLINLMIVPGSIYWNLAMGKDPGDVLKDEEGMQTMESLGKNMAWLLKKLQ